MLRARYACRTLLCPHRVSMSLMPGALSNMSSKPKRRPRRLYWIMLSLMVSLHLWVLFEMILVSPLYSNDVAVIPDMFVTP